MEEFVTKKNPKIVEAGKMGYQARLRKPKEEILTNHSGSSTSGTDGKPSGTGGNAGSTATTPGSNGTSTKDVYMYSVGLLAIIAV